MRDHIHVECPCFASDCAPDVAKPYDAECLTGDVSHRGKVLARPLARLDQLVMQHELARAHQEVHHRVIRHLFGTEGCGVGKNHTVFRGRLKVHAIVAVPERYKPLAPAVVAHMGEQARVPAMPLVYGAVCVLQSLDQFALGASGVTNELSAIFTHSSRLLFRLRRVVGVAALRTQIEDADVGVGHDVSFVSMNAMVG